MSARERQQRRRSRLREEQSTVALEEAAAGPADVQVSVGADLVSERPAAPSMPPHAPDLSSLDVGTIVDRLMSMPSKADVVGRILTQRLAIWRAGTYDIALARVARPSAYCWDEAAAAELPGPRRLRSPRSD